jgi:beta-galactosidase
MSEKFGPEEGIYWGEPDKDAADASGGDQAEDAKFEGAYVSTKGEDFHGRGFLDFGAKKGAYVQWYQENDGSAGEAELTIRYSCKAGGKKGRYMSLSVNERAVNKNLLFPNTNGWGTDWKEVKVTIPIRSGANTIRLTTIEAGGPNIDEISVK